MRKKLYNMLIEDYILHLVIGEDIPVNAPKEFHTVKLYIRDMDDNLNLYADISFPYLINHSEFLDIENDPRYFFKEAYNPKNKECKYICEIKPFGNMKGVYRILNGQNIKIQDIDPLIEIEAYDKLVRDNIPEIIKKNGALPIYKELNDEQYWEYLLKKDKEELLEVEQAASLEERKKELADKLELLRAMASFNGFSLQDIIEEADTKKSKNGGFEKKLLLVKVIEKK